MPRKKAGMADATAIRMNFATKGRSKGLRVAAAYDERYDKRGRLRCDVIADPVGEEEEEEAAAATPWWRAVVPICVV